MWLLLQGVGLDQVVKVIIRVSAFGHRGNILEAL